VSSNHRKKEAADAASSIALRFHAIEARPGRAPVSHVCAKVIGEVLLMRSTTTTRSSHNLISFRRQAMASLSWGYSCAGSLDLNKTANQ
jgi:hypothetical protein